ncbi:hypothetical protein EDF68_11331 [Ochrobactrum sp. BH3]|nr:hypothetical protein EDF68_11331 [Ochrobactrum sp. BH3]
MLVPLSLESSDVKNPETPPIVTEFFRTVMFDFTQLLVANRA